MAPLAAPSLETWEEDKDSEEEEDMKPTVLRPTVLFFTIKTSGVSLPPR